MPGATDPENLYAHSPAAQFRIGAEGITLPASRRTAHFSDTRWCTALTTAKDYLVGPPSTRRCSPAAPSGRCGCCSTPSSCDQFDQSFERPAADGRHAPTGWLVRFDPSQAELADSRIRVQGTLRAAEYDSDTLEVIADHTFVYALRPTGLGATRRRPRCSPSGASCTSASTATTCASTRPNSLVSYVQAGPLACSEDATNHLRPLLAGQMAKEGGPAGTDPYATGSATPLCGSLAERAQPKV